MTFQVVHDLYKPCHMEWKFQGGGGSKAKVPSLGGGNGYFLELHIYWKKKHVGEKSIANFTLKLLLFED